MAKKGDTVEVTTNTTTTFALTGRRDLFWILGTTWENVSVEIRSRKDATDTRYVVEETGIVANNNWSPHANIPSGAYIDIVTSGGTTFALSFEHQGG